MMKTAGTPKVRLRITRRGRAVVTGLVVSTVASLALTVALLPALMPSADRDAAQAAQAHEAAAHDFTYITVLAGQSMWEIAQHLAPSDDPRDVVADIVSLNQLESAELAAGQRLALPLKYTD